MANPALITEGCSLILENARSYVPVENPFANVVLILRPEKEPRVRVSKVRPIFGKSLVIQASDSMAALRGLAQLVVSQHRLPVRADALLISEDD